VLSTPLAWVFVLINLVMLVSAGVAGHIGGKLVFKD
jgi:L-cystine uptake protein TcyP (sodium:dicarboxylate symporter family)